MTPAIFNLLVEHRLAQMKAVLVTKSAEYSTDTDRLHNFKRSAGITGETPAEVCVGLWAKHMTSILDMVDDPAKSARPGLIEEKFTDALNYLVLLEAILTERNATHQQPTPQPSVSVMDAYHAHERQL